MGLRESIKILVHFVATADLFQPTYILGFINMLPLDFVVDRFWGLLSYLLFLFYEEFQGDSNTTVMLSFQKPLAAVILMKTGNNPNIQQ